MCVCVLCVECLFAVYRVSRSMMVHANTMYNCAGVFVCVYVYV